jgi:Hemocyanin, copper containing domain
MPLPSSWRRSEAGLGALSDDELKKVFRYQPRHGELFVYMHQQMLARYDAERLSVGLKPVEALRPKLPQTEIPEGYDPGAILSGPPFFFGPRKGGKTLDPDGAERLGKWRGAFDKAVDAKAYETPAGPAALDPTMSASISRPPCASSAAACRGAPTATCTTPATASSRTCPIRWTRRSRPAA